MVWLPVFGIFNVRTAVDARDCTQGAARGPDAVRESALEANSKHWFTTSFLQPEGKVPESDARSVHWMLTLGEKSLAAPGTRTRVSIVPGFSVGRSSD